MCSIVRFWVHNGAKFCAHLVCNMVRFCAHNGAKFCAQVVLLAQRMCPHASGVMPLGARGFFTHFSSPFVQSLVILGQEWCQVCQFGDTFGVGVE